MTRAINSFKMKESNKLKILSLIRECEVSRADLSRATGLSRAAITLITDELLAQGLIVEGESKKSVNGRRPTILELRSEAYIAVGIDISRDACNVSFIDFNGNSLRDISVDLQLNACNTIDLIVDCIKRAINDQFKDKTLLGIGISCPGPIDSKRGMILNPPGLELFHNCAICDRFAQGFDLPIYLEKDTNALAIAQKHSDHIDEDFIYILADHGLGCSYIKDGKVFSGRGGMGCEIGHVTMKLDGERCRCGNIGCAEIYASIPAALRSANKCGHLFDNWDDLVNQANAGDDAAIDSLKEYGNALSMALVGAANVLEPNCIVLGGELKRSPSFLVEIIQQYINNAALLHDEHKMRVIVASKEDSRARAAAQTVIEKYLLGE